MKPNWMNSAIRTHKVYHQFYNWMVKSFGEDLHGEWTSMKVGDKVYKYRNFKETEFNRRICGYDVIVKIENYIKRYCKEIEIVHCDDDVYAGSILLLIPHYNHGISVYFIPQCTEIQNKFFLYPNHYKMLMKKMNKVIKKVGKTDL